ncbi:MAG: endopeptidase La [Myxococcales bacterium]|nr:endopeptidase La [Myxococcales bacterium]
MSLTEDSGSGGGEAEILPILPLRNAVLFPAAVVPINVGRARSVRLVEELNNTEVRLIGVVTQRSPETEDPGYDDLYPVGVVARIVKVIKLGAQNYSVLLQGLARMKLDGLAGEQPYLRGKVVRLNEAPGKSAEVDKLGKELRDLARALSEYSPPVPRELGPVAENAADSGALADLVTLHLPSPPVTPADRQQVLEAVDLEERLKLAHHLARRVHEVHRVRKEIQSLVTGEMGRSEREEILRAQLKTIKEELGETDDSEEEIDLLRERIAKAKLPYEVEKVARRQLGRLRAMQGHSAEYQVTRSYVEWLVDIPWSKSTEDRFDVEAVRRALDEDHYGLTKPKKRILEYVAVRKLRKDRRGPILCFLGPPGVGKTSLAKSIARAVGRQMVRISLGGVRDEAEIRGHRRTYVGALPGRIIQAMKKAGTLNPIIILDEIDKMGADVRGDPAAALLEVLDPDQNSTFVDHYIDVPYDVSHAMFICTANNRDTIPAPLLDRMEVIEIAGYTRVEKLHIAREYIGPKALEEHGLTTDKLEWTDEGYASLIEQYTREAGVRNLTREVASVCRAVAVRVANGDEVHEKTTADFIRDVMGPPRFSDEDAERQPGVGIVAGLAWTPVGGVILFVEATRYSGKGAITITGQLGSVMKESAAAALSWVRTHAAELSIDPEFLAKSDLHVHVPAGGTPKDGPSAGVTIVTAITSLLTGRPVRSDIAMTGEITLRGVVLPIGGVKEKVLAAHRAGIRQVLLPARNAKDIEEIPDEIRQEMKIDLVAKIEDVLRFALLDAPPTPSILPPGEAAEATG